MLDKTGSNNAQVATILISNFEQHEHELYDGLISGLELQSYFSQLSLAILKTERSFQESVGTAINIAYGWLIECVQNFKDEIRPFTYNEIVDFLIDNHDELQDLIEILDETDDPHDSSLAGTKLFMYWMIAIAERYEDQIKQIGNEMTFFALLSKFPKWNPTQYDVFDSR